VIPVTEQLADFAIADHRVDTATCHSAARAFVDTIGVILAGAGDTSARTVGAVLEPLAGGTSTLLGSGARCSAKDAAMLNGVAGHALDFDDHLNDVNGHPSVVLVPALLALAEEQHADGQQMLEAYVVGYQVMCAVAAALPVRAHWASGWHATATLGVLASTAACGRLLGLDRDGMRHALGLAATLACGSRQNCGFMAKPLHAGVAASNGLFAARLAQRGFDADPAQLEAPIGFFSVFGVDPQLDRVSAVLSERWSLSRRGLNVKRFPACYATHRRPTRRCCFVTPEFVPVTSRTSSCTSSRVA
jgi:2-methylcitrate dehydratase PrpD